MHKLQPQTALLQPPLYIGSEVFRRAAFGANHPLKIVRHSAVLDLVRTLGWLRDEQGFAGEAVGHALRSGDIAQAKELVLKHWTSILNRGEVATLLRWLDALPEEIERGDPSLSLARCWALSLTRC